MLYRYAGIQVCRYAEFKNTGRQEYKIRYASIQVCRYTEKRAATGGGKEEFEI
jgi:uncharacterized protein YaaW (UPF0174 family)